MSRTQRGNILFLILLAVILFAALSYAVTNSLRGGGKNATQESLNLAVSEITNYATLAEQAVTRLRLTNDCPDTQISFHYDSDGDGTLETNGQDAYYNPNAPADYRCHVFRPEGGGLHRWKMPADYSVNLNGLDALAGYGGATSGNVGINMSNCVQDVGTTNGNSCDGTTNELLIMFTYLTPDLCSAINGQFGLPTTVSSFSYNSQMESGAFAGAYGATVNTLAPYNNSPAPMTGQRSFCFIDNSGSHDGVYIFQHVLIAR